MSLIFKITYYGSIVFIALCVIISILLKFLALEFTFQYEEEFFMQAFFWGLPIAVLLTVSRVEFRPGFTKATKKKFFINTLLISFGLFVVFIIYAFASLSDMCNWTTGETLFEHRTDHSVKILKRYFGCGATDSTPSTPGIYKETQFTPLFVYFTRIDTATLNAKDWISVQQQ